jgi:hypothetical protein
MKITKTELRQIIKEEMSSVLNEDSKFKQLLQRVFKKKQSGSFENEPFTKDEVKQLERKGWDVSRMNEPEFKNSLVGWDGKKKGSWPTHMVFKLVHTKTGEVRYVIASDTSDSTYTDINKVFKAPEHF